MSPRYNLQCFTCNQPRGYEETPGLTPAHARGVLTYFMVSSKVPSWVVNRIVYVNWPLMLLDRLYEMPCAQICCSWYTQQTTNIN